MEEKMDCYSEYASFFKLNDNFLPLSLGQYDIWVEQQLYPNDFSNNSNFVAKISSKIKVSLFQDSIFSLADRHESIRTIFPKVNGWPTRKILPSTDIRLQVLDCTNLTEDQIKSKIYEMYEKPFNLLIENPYKFILYKKSDCEYYLQIIEHHISVTMDAYVNLPMELAHLYVSLKDGTKSDLESQASTYSDFVQRQYTEFYSERFKSDERYWSEYLGDNISDTVLPTNRDAAFNSQSFIGKIHRHKFSEELQSKIKKVAISYNASPFTLLAASFQALLHLYFCRKEIILGIPCDTRRGIHKDVIGYTANTLPMRSEFASELRFVDFLKKYNSDIRSMIKHRLFPLSEIRIKLRQNQATKSLELFNIIIVSQKSDNFPELAAFGAGEAGVYFSVGDFKYESIGIGTMSTGRFDLALAIIETSRGHIFSFHYNSVQIEDSTIKELSNLYVHFLEKVADNPEQKLQDLAVYDQTAELLRLNSLNQTSVDFEQKGHFGDWFEEHALISPSSTAVICGDKKIDYKTLSNASGQLASYIHSYVARDEALIGLCINRSIQLIVSLLGVIKSGGAYLPLDPDLPSERLQFMLDDSQVNIVITEECYLSHFKNFHGTIILIDKDWDKISSCIEFAIHQPKENSLAYVIYTSGSTGKPKGVEILWRSLSNFLLAMQDKLQISSDDFCLALTTISFDISNLEILLPLSQGATVVLENSAVGKDPFLLSQSIKQHQITFAQATPATWQMLVDFGWKSEPFLTILCGGDALSKTLADRLAANARICWNMYGPTETTIWSSMKRINPQEEKITLGQPIANTTFYILTEDKELSACGSPGELYIGGFGLARGYRNRPDLTSERFIGSPFSNSLSDKLYKTGDLVRFLSNGEVEYLGRLDDQVKIRGHRIELGEIERVLEKCQGIQQAVVISQGEENRRLVAYYVGNTNAQNIRIFLSLYLPSYMLPSAYMQLTQFPLTHNGKVDRKSLPPQAYIDEQEYVAANTHIQKEIVNVFENILQIKKIGIDSNFFSIGGHSLLAAQAITKINQIFQIDLPLKTLFEKPTVMLLAKEVESASKVENIKLHKASKSEVCKLSCSQQRFWFLDQQIRDSSAYSIPFILEIKGTLDAGALQKAIDTIVEGNEILRTVFREGIEGPEQHILSKVPTRIKYRDLSSYVRAEEKRKILIEKEAKRPFELATAPLFRFFLIRTSESQYYLLVNFHHIIFDGYSVNIFINNLKLHYESYILKNAILLDTLQIQYQDVVRWFQSDQRQSLNDRQLTWWVKKLQEFSTLNLPIDLPRPNIQTYNGALFEFAILEGTNKYPDLMNLVNRNGTTLFVFLLSVFHVLLYRYTGQNDLVIGVPVSTRTHSELQNLIGCFINTLPLRLKFNSESSFLAILQGVKEEVLSAFENQDVPFEKIIEKLNIERSLKYTPLFQVMFNMLPEITEHRINNLAVTLKNIDRGTSHFDLSLSIQETSGGLVGIFEYNTDLFLKETIERMSRHFEKLVFEILKDASQSIGKLPMLLDEEIRKQVIEWNKQTVSYQNHGSIIQQIEKWAAIKPNAVAVICKGKKYTYSQINGHANKIAHALLKKGIKLEDKIVVSLERSAEFIWAILGILKAGGTYVPIDMSQPMERTLALLKDLDPICILTHSTLQERLPDYTCLYVDQFIHGKSDNPYVEISEEQLAYIIYTSGSTGQPKGVEIEHKSINDRISWKKAAHPLFNHDKILHTYSFIFDGAIINYFWPLCAGAGVVIATKEELLDANALINLIKKYKITTMDLLPSLLDNLLEEQEIHTCRSLKNVFSGGEALSKPTVQLFFQKFPKVNLYNTYGPTEATVEASVWPCTSEFSAPIAPIGKAIAGAQLFILDQNQNIVPRGVHGELHIGGLGLARGYFKAPIITADKFIRNPFSALPGRLYKTGDLAKYNVDGAIEFLGRMDNQVKIRGHRINLMEIESALLGIALIENSAVGVKGHGLHKHLVAYVVLTSPTDEQTFLKLMKKYLEKQLPSYMIPQHAVILENLPRLSNGKINYKILPDPNYDLKYSVSKAATCKNDLERQLWLIWKEILGLENISLSDNFFEIGGNSLLAMRLISKVRIKMSISIPLIRLFQYPTIESFSESLNRVDHDWSPVVCMQPNGVKEPFFCVHPVGGSILCYHALAKHWQADRPFYALQARGLETDQIPHESIEAMGKEYTCAIINKQPFGPYFIGGWSYGGLIAIEIVRQLLALGEKVSLLALIDTTANIEKFQNIDVEDESLLLSELTTHLVPETTKSKSRLSFKERFARFIENGGKHALKAGQKRTVDQLIYLAKANYRALQKFSIPSLDVNVVLIKSAENAETTTDYGWQRYFSCLNILKGPGDHWAITQNDYAIEYAKILQKALATADRACKAKLARPVFQKR